MASTPAGYTGYPTWPTSDPANGPAMLAALGAHFDDRFSVQKYATTGALPAASSRKGGAALVTADMLLRVSDGTSWVVVTPAYTYGGISFSGIYSASTPTPRAVRQGPTVFLEGTITSSSATFLAGTAYTLGTIAAGFRPAVVYTGICTANATAVAALTIQTDGTAAIQLNTGFTGNLWLQMQGVYRGA